MSTSSKYVAPLKCDRDVCDTRQHYRAHSRFAYKLLQYDKQETTSDCVINLFGSFMNQRYHCYNRVTHARDN